MVDEEDADDELAGPCQLGTYYQGFSSAVSADRAARAPNRVTTPFLSPIDLELLRP